MPQTPLEKLIDSLKMCSDGVPLCNGCLMSDLPDCCDSLLKEAADALERLKRKEGCSSFMYTAAQLTGTPKLSV